jgi:hypothetical protein
MEIQHSEMKISLILILPHLSQSGKTWDPTMAMRQLWVKSKEEPQLKQQTPSAWDTMQS